MDKLDKFKLASSSFTKQLITNSKTLGSKVKEILQTPTPESKLVDEATHETLQEPNWGLDLRICSMLNNQTLNGSELLKAIKKKIIGSNNVVSQRLGLDLLEMLSSNCDKVFSEIASEKVLDDMVEMILDQGCDDRNRTKAVRLIRGWGESDELMYLPVFRQTYLSLKTIRIPAAQQGGNLSPMHQTMGSLFSEQPTAPTNRYPMPDLDLMGIEDDVAPYTYAGQSVEQKKELLSAGRNSLDLLSSILDSGMEPIPINDELTVSMLEKCKEALPMVQRIAETTTDDDILLFEALNLHGELEKVISRCAVIKQIVESKPSKEDTVKPENTTPPPLTVEETTSSNEAKKGSVSALIHEENTEKEQTV
uniref:TOM1-like protein 2 n=1 Tax=Erigeron canadensis TaxID=72917 RepID=UPI001CB9C965|nr:TOM1-like protein 2 [Erigeron canadensis]